MSNPDARTLLRGVARGFGGAVLFALPIFMTMEMWELAVSIGRGRLALLLLTAVVLAVGLEKHFGMLAGARRSWLGALVDAGIALLTGTAAAGTVLTVLAVLRPIGSWEEAASILAIEALPATIGASYARSQLGEDGRARGDTAPRHEFFFMAAGAVVFAANVAPTEEVVLLAAEMRPTHGLGLVALELTLMHAFVYGVDFRGGSASPGGFWAVFRTYTLAGFAIALAISAYLLWTFGRLDGTGLLPSTLQVLVLGLPASVGAAAARLIL